MSLKFRNFDGVQHPKLDDRVDCSQEIAIYLGEKHSSVALINLGSYRSRYVHRERLQGKNNSQYLALCTVSMGPLTQAEIWEQPSTCPSRSCACLHVCCQRYKKRTLMKTLAPATSTSKWNWLHTSIRPGPGFSTYLIRSYRSNAHTETLPLLHRSMETLSCQVYGTAKVFDWPRHHAQRREASPDPTILFFVKKSLQRRVGNQMEA